MSSTLLDLRRSGLGGTDASAVLGMNPWRTPLQVWSEKRGLVPPQETTEAMRWGLLLEPVIAERYTEETGRKLIAPENVYHHPKHDFLLATPDRLCTSERRGLEIKTASSHTSHEWGRPRSDEVPRHYLIQCMHYMAVLGYRVWDLAVLIGGNDFRIYTITWDQSAADAMIEQEVAWWQRHMIGGEEPAAVADDNDFLARRYPRDTMPELKAASMEAYGMGVELKLAMADRDDAIARLDAAQASLKALIGDGAGIEGDGWRVTWKATKPRESVDWEAVARTLADENAVMQAAQEHTTTKPGPRVFRYSEDK